MENRLLDREVLCIFDTRHIQRYIFRSDTMTDAIGGSDLVNHILQDAIRYSLSRIEPSISEGEYDLTDDPDATIPYFEDSRVKIQQIVCTAGNALFMIRTGALAQKLIRKISRYYLENGYNLDMAAAAVENTGDFAHDSFLLFNKLNAVKASSETLEPIGALPVVVREQGTGEPVVGFDENSGEPISESSRIRRQEACKRENILTFQDINTTLLGDGKSYRAVIHADGNNLGITIGKAIQKASCYEEAIRLERLFSRMIPSCISSVMGQTMMELEELYRTATGRSTGFDHEFMIVHSAGDDINCVCNAKWAFPFVDLFYKNLRGACILKTAENVAPLYVCTGIAIVTGDHDFHAAFNLAEECCANAKKSAKKAENLRDGFAGNWIDFHIAEGTKLQELDLLRDRFYVTEEQVSLICRPYCMDDEAKGRWNDYRRLMQLIGILKKLNLTDFQKAVLHQSYLLGIREFNQWITRIKRNGLDLIELLGNPTCQDNGKVKHATWFDAVELMDFISQTEHQINMSTIQQED